MKKYVLMISVRDDSVERYKWESGRLLSGDFNLLEVDAENDETALAAYRAFVEENNGGLTAYPEHLLGVWRLDDRIEFDGPAMRQKLVEEYQAAREKERQEKERGVLRELLAKYPDEGTPR